MYSLSPKIYELKIDAFSRNSRNFQNFKNFWLPNSLPNFIKNLLHRKISRKMQSEIGTPKIDAIFKF